MGQLLTFLFDELLPALISHIDSWMISDGVSVLGFGVCVSILIVIISAIVLRV